MRSFAILFLTALLTVTIATAANAAVLFWKKVITTQLTYAGCMKSARTNGLYNPRVSADEVAGYSVDGQIYVAITCVERGATARAVAVIAGVGADLAAVRRQVEFTAEQVRTAGVPDY